MTKKTFAGNYRNLEEISTYIINQAEQAGFSSKEIYAIQTAVDEACANIIDHAYGGEDLGEIEIEVKQIKNGIRIILEDKGRAFDPDEVPTPDLESPLENRRERGLGIFFIRQLMDEAIFDFSNANKNTLTLIKYKGG